MKSDEAILAEIDEAFGSVPRPELFTVADGDPETMDHEALLSSRDRETLTLEDVNRPGNPMTECLLPGFAYYFPALARLALVQPVDPWYWYASVLLDKLMFDARQPFLQLLQHQSESSGGRFAPAHSRDASIDGQRITWS